jgi:hypothetical protein
MVFHCLAGLRTPLAPLSLPTGLRVIPERGLRITIAKFSQLNRLELVLMPAYHEPLRRKKQSLGYLCEDLTRKLTKLRDWNDQDQIDCDILDQAANLTSEIAGLDIGIERRLNDLQYCLGEIRVHLWEDSAEYLQVEDCIAQIQNFLDGDL